MKTLDSSELMKACAQILFNRPELLEKLPDLTTQLQRLAASQDDISAAASQERVLSWIDDKLKSPRAGHVRIAVNSQPARPDADLEQPIITNAPLPPPDGLCQDLPEVPGEGPSCRPASPSTGLEDEELDAAGDGSQDSEISFDMPKCILQFSTPVYYAKEGEDEEMVLDVMRLGSDAERVTCKFETRDGDGKAGLRYAAVSGDLVFEPGEIMKQIMVPIIESRAWSSSLEFKVVLSDVTGDCVLGRYLYLCRVKVIDPDCFPTNKFEEKIRADDFDQIPMFSLLVEYFKFNFFSNPIVTSRSTHQLVTDQISNLYFTLRLVMVKVVIDKILPSFDPAKPEIGCNPSGYVFSIGGFGFVDCPKEHNMHAKFPLLMMMAGIVVLPNILVHYVEWCEVFFKIGGTSRKTLQGNLVRKFLNYDDSSRSQLGPSDLVMSMTRDTQSLVHDGYMQLFPLAQAAGKLLMMVILQFFLEAHLAILPVFIYPLVLIPVLLCRNNLTQQVSAKQDKAQNELTDYISEVMVNFRLIGDYLRRPDAVADCEAKVGMFNKRSIDASAVNLNNAYVCKWLALSCISAWTVIGGNLVLAGDSEVGTFVTNLSIFKDVGEAWTVIFEVMLKMQSALPYLEKVVRYMNLPIDLEKRMRLNRKRRAAGEVARKSARMDLQKAQSEGKSMQGVFAADFVRIELKDVSYTYVSAREQYLHRHHHAKDVLALKEVVSSSPKTSPRSQEKEGSLETCSMSFPQGTWIALIGLPGNGKSTLMKMLGSQIIPDSGDLLIPPHLRALHCSPQPAFFHDTLYANLTYGVGKDNIEDGDIQRVRTVCRRLKISEKLLRYLNRDDPEMFEVSLDWGDILSTTQRVLLSHARALIANPEILVIHKPTIMFDEATAKNTLTCLSEFIDKRGLCMDEAKIAYRRPRTCIITATRPQGIEAADHVFRVTPTAIFEVKRKSEVTSDLLK